MEVFVVSKIRSIIVVLTLASCGAKFDDTSNISAAVECPRVNEADETAITQERANMLIGFTEADAESCATTLGWAFRVGERDGESFPVTADYSQQRVTVSATNDLVTAVAVG